MNCSVSKTMHADGFISCWQFESFFYFFLVSIFFFFTFAGFVNRGNWSITGFYILLDENRFQMLDTMFCLISNHIIS